MKSMHGRRHYAPSGVMVKIKIASRVQKPARKKSLDLSAASVDNAARKS